MGRTVPCNERKRAGRISKAREFFGSAEKLGALADPSDLVDARVELYIQAGIAAADVVCCAQLGEHASGQDHNEAVALLKQVDASLALDLSRILKLKARTSYGSEAATGNQLKQAQRAAGHLLAVARLLE